VTRVSSCSEPLDLATLVDYWFGDLDGPDLDRVEEHLLGCDACGSVLRSLVATGDGVRRLARQGAFGVVVSPAFLETASRQGLRVREYRVPAGGRVDCTVTAEDDLLIGRLQGDFRGVSRLDLVVQVEDGPEHRVFDLPVSPSSVELIVAQAMPAVRAMPSSTMRMRLLAREGESDRLVGEYTFAHTASGTGRE
jgi:putative zinc finger protein